jgi:hypothetical protein
MEHNPITSHKNGIKLLNNFIIRIPNRRIFLEKIIVAQIMKIFQSNTKPESSLECSQELANELYLLNYVYHMALLSPSGFQLELVAELEL